MAKIISLLPTLMFACLLFHLIFNIRLDVAVRDGRYHLFCFRYDTDTFKGQYRRYRYGYGYRYNTSKLNF